MVIPEGANAANAARDPAPVADRAVNSVPAMLLLLVLALMLVLVVPT